VHQAEKKGKGASIKDMTAKYKAMSQGIGRGEGQGPPEVDLKDDELKKVVGYAVGAK